ncbi:Sec-independent protein translocase protein TatB [Falsiroseomonas sp. HW251]|uniref:Sec-independent protein translocase protein TatB n=1 Tax=Falsiroseomonas sp. HW251 TaxID=3390998 RepID=UPI003D30FDA9
MLGLDWTELALIAVVAVVVIGPKDLPDAVRGVAKGIQKLRRMAGELQTQLDEVVREAKLEDVRSQINEIRNFDFRSVVEKEIDKDGSLRKTFTEDPIGNPLRDAFTQQAPAHGAEVTPPPQPGTASDPEPPPPPEAPAFVPPAVASAAAPVAAPSAEPVAVPSAPPATPAAAPAPATVPGPTAPAGSNAA